MNLLWFNMESLCFGFDRSGLGFISCEINTGQVHLGHAVNCPGLGGGTSRMLMEVNSNNSPAELPKSDKFLQLAIIC